MRKISILFITLLFLCQFPSFSQDFLHLINSALEIDLTNDFKDLLEITNLQDSDGVSLEDIGYEKEFSTSLNSNFLGFKASVFSDYVVRNNYILFFTQADIIDIAPFSFQPKKFGLEYDMAWETKLFVPNEENFLQLYLLAEKKRFSRSSAIAGKYRFPIKDFLVSIGGWYKYKREPRIVCAFFKDIFYNGNIFSEFIGGLGSEEQWTLYRNSGAKDISGFHFDFIPQFTVAFTYEWENISVSTQYFFNGFGVSNPRLISKAEFSIKRNWYSYVGRHYLSFSLLKENFPWRSMSGLFYGIVSLTDFSGQINMTMIWNVYSSLFVQLGCYVIYGRQNSEYVRGFYYSPSEVSSTVKKFGGISFSLKVQKSYN